jgi:phosphoribosylanthranilate isomerase
MRSQRDLRVAIRGGADAVGLICGVTHVSEDAVQEDVARLLAGRTPPFVSTVLVTHLESSDEILQLARFIGVDSIQLHGLVDHETVAAVVDGAEGRRVIKAVHVTGPEALEEADHYARLCHALQLDSRTPERLGGTGQVHDWSISRAIVDAMRARGGPPVILSGGLRPENVREAVELVSPYGVDVNSGVEDAEGDKVLERVANFVSIARTVPNRDRAAV